MAHMAVSSSNGPEVGATAPGSRAKGRTAGHRPPPADVWTRTEARYRVRAYGLLIVNLALFCGLCVFTHWLHQARPFDFSWQSYLAPLQFWASDSPNLNSFVLGPVRVTQVPAQALVLGLVFASIVAVPIVISILYRLPSSIPFLLAVVIFAHMPWMAVTLLGSCILVSVRPFRLSFRFASALVGLIPVLLYLYLAARGGADVLEQASPTQKSLLVIPWLFALLAAVGMIAAVLLISKAVNYRPEAVAPVVAVMFAMPVGLFHFAVGADELGYRVIEAEYGPRAQRFAPILNIEPVLRNMLRRFANDDAYYRRFRDDILSALGGEPDRVQRLIARQLQLDFLADRAAAHEACRKFIADFPRSRYVPAVLYIQARALDTRMDQRMLDLPDIRRELYADFPHAQSEPVWAALFREHRDSPLSAAAGLRLAQLALRRGEVDTAEHYLQHSMGRRVVFRMSPTAATQPRGEGLLRPSPVEEGLAFEPSLYSMEATRWMELLESNRDDPQWENAPLADWAGLDPHRPGFAQQLLRLMERYRDSRLHDNMLVRWADSQASVGEREALLRNMVPSLLAADARAEALFRLAEIEAQPSERWTSERNSAAIERLREVAGSFPGTHWGRLARDRLDSLTAGDPQRESSRP